jgi:DME family drug/metabolite transporter
MQTSPVRSRLALLAAAALFSTGGAAFKAVTLTAWQVAGARSAVAVVVLLLAIPEARGRWTWRMVPVAAAYAATLVLFVVANRLTTSANAIFLQSAAPLYVLLLGPLLLHEPIQRSHVFYMAAVAGGMALFFLSSEPAVATAPDPPRGNLIAAFSGVTYACMLVGLRWLTRGRHDNPGLATAVMGNLVAAFAMLPLALPLGDPRPIDAVVILYLGAIQIGLAYVLLTRAIRHVPAVEATTLLVIEPVLNPLWAWLIHREIPGLGPLAGGAVILSATLAHTRRDQGKR